MEPRFVAVVGGHLVGALVFAAMATRSAVLGEPVFAVALGVLPALIVVLCVGIVRSV